MLSKNRIAAYLFFYCLVARNPIQAMFTHVKKVALTDKRELAKRSKGMAGVRKILAAEIMETSKEAEAQNAKAQRPKKCYNLVMALDFDEQKAPQEEAAFIPLVSQVLFDKSIPLLVTSNVVKNVCLWKTDPNLLPEKLKNYPLPDLTDNDYEFYGLAKTPLMLLVPKNYIAQWTQDSAVGSIRLCGFNTDNLVKIDNSSLDDLLEYIKNNDIF